MKRIPSSLAVVVLTTSLLMLPAAGLAQDTTARSNLHQVNKSGIQHARLTFTETVVGLIVTGTASGLAPSTIFRYFSLVYDVGSVPGGPVTPGNAGVCEPTVEMDGMFVGTWVTDSVGNGFLLQLVAPGDIAPLNTFDTVSIRDITINAGFGVEAVSACGQVAVNP